MNVPYSVWTKVAGNMLHSDSTFNFTDKTIKLKSYKATVLNKYHVKTANMSKNILLENFNKMLHVCIN